MKLRKNWKRFWTLNRHHAEGFTLVELIVVIAILAILGGVAVPAYSGYVKKANMQADMTLVSDVADALTLYYYSHPTDGVTGYVVLKPNGAVATSDGTVGSAAMQAVFGDGWQNTATLKYDGWSDNDLLGLVADYTDDELKLVANSSFLTNSTSQGLMNAVTDLTGLVGDVIRDKSADPAKARQNLTLIFGEDSEILDKLDALDKDGLKGDDYPTAISNLLVNTMATNIETEPCLKAIVNMYATAYAYGEKTGDFTAFEQMNTNLENVSMEILSFEGESTEQAYGVGYLTMLDGMMDENDAPITGYEGFLDYLNVTGGEQIQNDNDALSTMMGAVKQISDSFVDVDSLTNPELFASGEVANQVNDYMNSVKALAEMDETTRATLSDLPAGSVAVFVTKDGVVSATPNAAFLQD